MACFVLSSVAGCEANPEFDEPSVERSSEPGATETGGAGDPEVTGPADASESETHVESEEESGSGSADGSESSDATGDDTDPAVIVDKLESAWTTPNQIRWEWKVEGSHDDLFAFELVTGPTKEDVVQQSSQSRTWTVDDNPELGYLLDTSVPWISAVSTTTTDAHEPKQEYYAQLRAIDTQGRISKSNVANARTQLLPVHSLVVYSDEDPPFRMPDELVFVEEQPHAGTKHGQWLATEDVWVNVRWQEMFSDLSAMGSGEFKTNAHLEFYLAVDLPDGAPLPPPSIEVSLWYNGPENIVESGNTYYTGMIPRVDGAYHVRQIPLRHFVVQDKFGGHAADLELVHLGLYQFSVGARWQPGTKIRVDEVRILW